MHPSKQKVVGLRIQQFRIKSGLSQLEFARKLENKTTLEQLQDYECGKNITFPLMSDAAKALRINPADLYPESMVMPRDIYGKPAPQEEVTVGQMKKKPSKHSSTRKHTIMMTPELSTIFRTKRLESKKTFKKIAQEAKISPTVISYVERDIRSFSITTLQKLADYYGIDISKYIREAS